MYDFEGLRRYHIMDKLATFVFILKLYKELVRLLTIR